MRRTRDRGRVLKVVLRLGLLALLLALAACSPRQLVLQEVAGALATQGSAPEDDLVLAREASAFYLNRWPLRWPPVLPNMPTPLCSLTLIASKPAMRKQHKSCVNVPPGCTNGRSATP